jgi:hypothetical protein
MSIEIVFETHTESPLEELTAADFDWRAEGWEYELG